MNLRDVPTEALRRELADRSRCDTCRTEWSSKWHDVGNNRIRCDACMTIHRARNPRLFK